MTNGKGGFMELEGKTVIITGGGRGIGKHITLAYAKEKANVVIGYVGHKDEAEATAKEARLIGVDAITVQGDVANYNDVLRLRDLSYDRFGTVHIVVNNAGLPSPGPFLSSTPEDLTRVMMVNAMGPIFISQVFSNRWIEEFDPDSSVERELQFTGSIRRFYDPKAVENGAPSAPGGTLIYVASKSAMHGFAQEWATRVKQFNIKVNAIGLGFVDHTMNPLPESQMRENIAQNSEGRILSVEEVGKYYVDLAKSNNTGVCEDASLGFMGRVEAGLPILPVGRPIDGYR
jgi:3-oxoacyl-[acyl-carrier protein] reductase